MKPCFTTQLAAQPEGVSVLHLQAVETQHGAMHIVTQELNLRPASRSAFSDSAQGQHYSGRGFQQSFVKQTLA